MASTVLSIHIWAGVFVFLGVASSNYLIAENLTKITFYRTLAGVTVNIFLNLILVPFYGIMGAAFATLVSQFVSAFFSNLFFKKSRIIFIMFLKSLNLFILFKKIK
jgi:O-antigen/teichoic acid export membrane protein